MLYQEENMYVSLACFITLFFLSEDSIFSTIRYAYLSILLDNNADTFPSYISAIYIAL